MNVKSCDDVHGISNVGVYEGLAGGQRWCGCGRGSLDGLVGFCGRAVLKGPGHRHAGRGRGLAGETRPGVLTTSGWVETRPGVSTTSGWVETRPGGSMVAAGDGAGGGAADDGVGVAGGRPGGGAAGDGVEAAGGGPSGGAVADVAGCWTGSAEPPAAVAGPGVVLSSG